MKTQAKFAIIRTRSLSAGLWTALAALLVLWACNVESTPGSGTTNLRFDKIADSLADEGYDRLEITVNNPGMDAPAALYQGPISPVEPVPMPEGIGDSYQVTLNAFDDQKPGQVFQKVYTIVGGKVIGGGISVIPGDPGPIVPDPVVPDPVVPDPDPSDNAPLPSSVTINPGSLGLADGGDTATLKAFILPENANQEVYWKSGNPAVATVDASGLVRSVAVGAATVYAQAAADTGKQAFIEVTVSKPASVDKVELEPRTLRLFTGGPAGSLQASVSPAGIPLLLNWESSDPSVAAVGADGKVTGLAAGTALISAHYKGDASKSDTCRVTVVKDAPILDVGEDVSVQVGATVEFTIKVTQEFGGIVEYRWSLDGDTIWDGISATLPATLSRQYTVPADVYAFFSVTDGEGNVVHAKRLIRVGSAAPLVVIESPKDGDTVGTNPLTISYKVNNVSLSKSVPLVEGRNRIGADTVVNGARGFDSITVYLNSKVPEVAITSPKDGFVTGRNVIDVVWTVDNQVQTIRLKDTLRVEGENTITRAFTNSAGITGSKSIKVILDTKKPVVAITSPATGTISKTSIIDVSWKVDNEAQTILLKDTLKAEGENIIRREFTDLAGNKGADSVMVILDSKAPVVAITSPLPGTFTKSASIDVAWTVDNAAQTTQLKETLLVEGENVIRREFTDAAGNKGSASVTVTLDTKAPIVAITSPAAGATVAINPVPVVWTVDSESQTTLTSESLPAGDGVKTITRTFTDKAGNTGTKTITVVLDLVKPKSPVMNAAGTTASPTNAASVTWKWTSGGAGGNGTFRYWMNSAAVPITPAPIMVSVAEAVVAGLAEGSNTIYVQEGDDQGNWSPTASQAIVIDRTLPTAIVFDGGATQSVAAAAFTVSVAVSDAGSGLAAVSVAGASAGNGAMALSGTGTAARYTKAVTLAAGANTLTVTATDRAGNVRTGTATVTFALPVINIVSPAEGFVTNNGAITITYTVGSSTAQKTKNVVLDDGAHTVTVSETGAESKNLRVYVYSNLVFVRKSGPATGDGSSWDNAFNDLDKALTSTAGKKPGNRIWISAGTYNCLAPAASGKSKLTGGVSLYGGFPATGRPNTETGRNYAANKTILTNLSSAAEGGIIDLDDVGQSTVDGIVFNQVKPGGQVMYVNNSATFSNCEFHSTVATGYYVYMGRNTATFSKCVFSDIKVHHAIISTYQSYVTIANSSFTNNNSRYLVYLEDWNVNISTTTISGNTAVSPDYPKPAIWVSKGTLTQGSGNSSDVPIRQN